MGLVPVQKKAVEESKIVNRYSLENILEQQLRSGDILLIPFQCVQGAHGSIEGMEPSGP